VILLDRFRKLLSLEIRLLPDSLDLVGERHFRLGDRDTKPRFDSGHGPWLMIKSTRY
jgi:hypothetical protein